MNGAVLTVRVPVDFTPDDIRYTDSGGFDASNRAAMLSRRPRSAQGWEPKWGVPHYAWSTPLWDWAAGTWPPWTEICTTFEIILSSLQGPRSLSSRS
ncbi:hypothetical protein [Rhodococcus sp. (in: high G+C Gram-positive bacteria)]|uniref:hypothetical protein n=1 Tax=Rhodococcus sp. TaxID=1831 RepID=UPI001A291247|nr:hypothetical protein [Rhodococcus sp. (in: high G+C Gram-positive bacteria)]MBJ7481515.1 hypothetical protein [Rhodococcus sp. (in: high G+C Gram-positive bacteria)]